MRPCYTTSRYLVAPALLLLTAHTLDHQRAAAATGTEAAQATEAGATDPKVAFAPIVDHHIHLLSPAAAAWKTPPPLPEIKLPEELAQVLQLRIDRRTDLKGLEEIYTSDALFYSGGGPGWSRGREAAAGRVVWTISEFPYRVAPVAYRLHGSHAEIAGYFLSTTDYSDENRNGSPKQMPSSPKDLTDRFGNAFLSLRKGEDGKWRIASETFVYDVPSFAKPVSAQDKIKEMDAAGTRLGTVVSNAYYFDSAQPEPVLDALAKIRADNDWLGEQVAQFPDRLVAFCSVNPVKDYALSELQRCASSGKFVGLKLHFNAAQVKLRDPKELASIRAVMAAANKLRMPMLIHVRPGNDYNAEVAEIFLRQLVTAAPDVPIQIAHLWGGESYSSSALKVYADAVSRSDPATRNLYFDVSAVLIEPRPPEQAQEIVARMREIGMARLLWGSDASIAEALQGFRKNVPLTEQEFRAISNNVAPYLRDSRSSNADIR